MNTTLLKSQVKSLLQDLELKQRWLRHEEQDLVIYGAIQAGETHPHGLSSVEVAERVKCSEIMITKYRDDISQLHGAIDALERVIAGVAA